MGRSQVGLITKIQVYHVPSYSFLKFISGRLDADSPSRRLIVLHAHTILLITLAILLPDLLTKMYKTGGILQLNKLFISYFTMPRTYSRYFHLSEVGYRLYVDAA